MVHHVHLSVNSLSVIVLDIPVRPAKHKENLCHEDEGRER